MRRHQFRRDSARVVTRRGRFPEGTTLFRCNSPCSAPVLHEPLQDGPDRRLDDVVELVRFDNRRRVARPALPGNMSAGSRSCRHPPRGTKTSGLSSRPSRTPARTLPLARTLLPPVSASASPGRPTQSLPPPDVDSHATPAAVLGDFARPPRARHVAPQCQESQHRRPPVERAPHVTVPWAQSARGHRVERLFDDLGGRWTCDWDGRQCAPTKRPKSDLSARTRYRVALLERWLAPFWNEAEV